MTNRFSEPSRIDGDHYCPECEATHDTARAALDCVAAHAQTPTLRDRKGVSR